jgi:hypothetical protein
MDDLPYFLFQNQPDLAEPIGCWCDCEKGVQLSETLAVFALA